MAHRTIGPVTSTIGVATAMTSIIAWALREFTVIDIPVDIQAAITVVIVFISGWSVPPQNTESFNNDDDFYDASDVGDFSE